MSKTMKITIEGEDYGSSTREWQVEDELVRPYCIAYDGWISKGGVELSKAIYEQMGELGVDTLEMTVARQMVDAVK